MRIVSKVIDIGLLMRVLGMLIIFEGLCMLVPSLVSFIYHEEVYRSLLISSGVVSVFGLLMFLLGTKLSFSNEFNKREGCLLVASVWVVFSFLGLLPFYISGAIPNITDAFFETISGFTTTGASILEDIEAMPKGLLFWRSMIMWLGGMGIIILTLAIMPFLGGSTVQLFMAESTGPMKDKLSPRVSDTAKRLWGLYIVLSLIETVLLRLGGMDWFDAICHTFATISTGGFSTKQDSIGHWNSPYIQYVVIIFMILGGVNFILHYFALTGKWRKILKNEEFRIYWGMILVLTISLFIYLLATNSKLGSVESIFRASMFQIVSILTTTGFCTANYIEWGSFMIVLVSLLFFIGGSAGSTSGGIKVIRISLLIKNFYYELYRLIYPNAVMPVRYNEKTVTSQVMNTVVAFVSIYILVVIVSTIILTLLGLNVEEAFSASGACLSSIGPGLGSVGPVGSYAALPIAAKWLLTFLMLIGRLELYTVLLLFVPSFWNK